MKCINVPKEDHQKTMQVMKKVKLRDSNQTHVSQF
jgi:hypothetical protein